MTTQENKNLFAISTDPDAFRADCIVLVKTEWNHRFVDELEAGCRRKLQELGVSNIRTIQVPGAMEIAFGIRQYWEQHKYRDDRPKAFIALGCVIKGDTPHFDYVCKGVTDGVVQLNLTLPVPVIYGILTVTDARQAEERTGGKHGHKGEEAAITALKMVLVSRTTK